MNVSEAVRKVIGHWLGEFTVTDAEREVRLKYEAETSGMGIHHRVEDALNNLERKGELSRRLVGKKVYFRCK